jgi:alginate O-acetyltransferase complex protein AlgI
VVFASIPFLFFFLPIFLAAYFATPGTRAKNAIALLFSLVFYAWGEPRDLAVLLGATAFNALGAIVLDARRGRARRATLAAIVIADILLLGTFKYAGFIAGNLALLLRPLGAAAPIPALALPLGISFFTFHCLSYVIDVYRRRFPANRDPLEIALYIALFPQLIAGPIVRYATIARALHARRHTLARASAGMRIFIVGLAQKVLLADQVAPVADALFEHPHGAAMADSWLGLLAYSLQIYFDFAGYSNMAIGLGLVLGFALPRNFRLPYTALSLTEFWRRWHMSLSAWLRDYLYIPLGGSRGPAWATWRNLVTVFLLCGLWHGAGWTFLLWGAWHGGFLVIERLGLARLLARLPALLRWLYATLAVMGGWVLFRAHDLVEARTLAAGLLGRHGAGPLSFRMHTTLTPLAMLALAAGAVLAVAPRFVRPPRLAMPLAAETAVSLALLLLAILFVAAGGYSPFLYFRF